MKWAFVGSNEVNLGTKVLTRFAFHVAQTILIRFGGPLNPNTQFRFWTLL